MGGLVLLIVSIFLYFLPSFLAYNFNKKQKFAILVLNTTVGWTLIGWIACLVWASLKD